MVSPLDIVADKRTIVAERICGDDEPSQCKTMEGDVVNGEGG